MVIDTRTQLIYDDINLVSDILIKRIKEKGYEATNDIAHGRVIYELMWFKQEIREQRLNIPMDRDERASISYIYTNGDIRDIDDSDLLLSQLVSLTDNKMILKPENYPNMIEKIKKLLRTLEAALRPLSEQEYILISELNSIIPKLEEKKIVPYKDFKRNTYPGLWFSYNYWRGSSLDDISEAGELIKIIKEGLVNGVHIEF